MGRRKIQQRRRWESACTAVKRVGKDNSLGREKDLKPNARGRGKVERMGGAQFVGAFR